MSETIGERLRRLREERGLRVVEVAQRIRMNESYVRQVERNEHAPGLCMATDLAKLYGVSLDYVACLTDHEKNPYVHDPLPRVAYNAG